MTVQFSKELLEQYFAPGIDRCRPSGLRDLSGEIADRSWAQNHFLNSICGSRFNEEWRSRVVVLAFRVRAGFDAYDRARLDCEAFVKNSIEGHPATRQYFSAIAQWEMVVLNLHHAIDIFRQLEGKELFEEANGVANLREVANRIKHCAEDIETGLHKGLTIPMWMTDTGLKTRTAELNFGELIDNLVAMARIVGELQNPSELVARRP